jgi:hypothetical protein
VTQEVIRRLSPRRPGFHPGPVRVRCVVGKVQMGLIFLRELRFYLAIVIPPVLYTYHLNIGINQKDKRAKPGNPFRISGGIGNIRT